MAKMLAASIPPISQELFDELVHVFKRIAPEPNVTTMEEIMFNAGQVAVIEWIRVHALRGSTITGAMPDVAQSIDMRAT